MCASILQGRGEAHRDPRAALTGAGVDATSAEYKLAISSTIANPRPLPCPGEFGSRTKR
jgi:hypothetical protein